MCKLQGPSPQHDIDLEVRVSGLGGSICTVIASRSWLIHEVKSAIESETSIPVKQQRLLHQTAELYDDSPLIGFAAWPEVDITLVKRSEEQVKWLQAAEADWTSLLSAPPEVWGDREVVALAVNQCGWALQHADPALRADPGLVLQAVRQNGLTLQHASQEMQRDEGVVLAAVTQCGRALAFAEAGLKTDRAFTLAAVQKNGRALEHVSPELKTDREVVLAAVKQCGLSLGSAASSLKADYGVVMEAILQDGGALAFAAGSLRADSELKALASRSVQPLTVKHEPRHTVKPSAMSADNRAIFFGGGRADGHVGLESLIGTRGAHLCEMVKLGLPVSPGFCVSTQRGAAGIPPDLKGMVKQALAEVEQSTGQVFGSLNNPLLLMVSGDMDATNAMHGLTGVGLNDNIAEAWANTQENPRFIWDAYRRLITSFAQHAKRLCMEPFEQAIQEVRARLDAGCQLGRQHQDSDIPMRDLRRLVEVFKALYQQQAGEAFPQDPEVQLWESLRCTWAPCSSCDSESAIAVVQAAVLSSSVATGIMHSYGGAGMGMEGEWLDNAQVGDVAAKKRTPRKISKQASEKWAESRQISEQERVWSFASLEEEMPSMYAKLLHCHDTLQCHFLDDMPSVEFVAKEGRLWLLQSASSPGAVPAGDDVNELSVSENENLGESMDLNNLMEAFPCDTITDAEGNRPMEEQPEVTGSDGVFAACPPMQALPSATFAFRPSPKASCPKMAVTEDTKSNPAHEEGNGPASATGPASAMLRLPFWQTAVAGGLAGLGARFLAGSLDQFLKAGLQAPTLRTVSPAMVAATRMLPTGAICCTGYVNLLSLASPDGDLDSVRPVVRLGCAATAATAACALTHPLDAGQARLLAARAAVRSIASPQALFGSSGLILKSMFRRPMGLGVPALLPFVPVTAIEMCTIDVVKKAGIDAGCAPGPGLLFFSGAVAGAVSQTIAFPLGAAYRFAAEQRHQTGEVSGIRALGTAVAARGPGAFFKGISSAYARSMPAVGLNSLVRVGLVSNFLSCC